MYTPAAGHRRLKTVGARPNGMQQRVCVCVCVAPPPPPPPRRASQHRRRACVRAADYIIIVYVYNIYTVTFSRALNTHTHTPARSFVGGNYVCVCVCARTGRSPTANLPDVLTRAPPGTVRTIGWTPPSARSPGRNAIRVQRGKRSLPRHRTPHVKSGQNVAVFVAAYASYFIFIRLHCRLMITPALEACGYFAVMCV